MLNVLDVYISMHYRLYMFNDVLRDMDIDDATRDAHIDCLNCGQDGCRGCPAGSLCDLPRLVSHEGEWFCPECVPAFEERIENRDADASDGVPVLLADDEPETTPIEPLTDAEIAKLDPLGIFKKEAA